MKYGYARVSTRQQDLEGQLRQLEEERCDRVYFEKITGTKKGLKNGYRRIILTKTENSCFL